MMAANDHRFFQLHHTVLAEIYCNDVMGLSVVKGFTVLLSATLFQLTGCDRRDDS